MADIQYIFKIVVDFTSPLSEADILSRMAATVIPDMDARIQARLGSPFINNLAIQRKLKLFTLDAVPTWEMYPKVVITGDTNRADDIIERRLDLANEDMKDILDIDINAQGGAVIGWHRHLVTGPVDEGGF